MGYYDDVLEHHGILGQKWGVRRFESSSGHLTAAGKNRYNSVDGKYQKVKKVTAALTDPMRNAKGGPVKDNVERENNLRRKYGKKTTFENNQEYIKPVEDSSRKANSSDTKPTEKKGLTDKQKKMIIAGAAVVGTAVAAYGGYKLYQLNEKAKEGLSEDLHKKAVRNIVDGRNMETFGDSLVGPDGIYKPSLQRDYNYAKGMSLMKEGAHQRHLGEEQAFRARQKNFTLKEKYDYLKKGKTTDDDYMAKMHRELAEKERANRAGIEKQFAERRRQQELEAQKTARAAQSANTTPPKAPSSLNPIQKVAWNASVSLVNKSREKTATRTINSGSKVTSNTIKIAGQQKFNQAAKANDDLVQELLKKNTIRF